MAFARLLLGLACVIGVLGTQRPADARVIPEFDWAACTWGATHVVVARQEASKKDGYTVLESWIGP